MSESDKPTSGDDWGGPEETPWQQQPPPQQPPPPPQNPQYGQQPPPYSQQPQQQPPYNLPPTHQPGTAMPNYLVHSILATLLCCPPTGIVGIVFASQVNGKVAAGDLAGAKKSSDQAKLWTLISVGAGFIGWIVYVAAVNAGGG
jgi:hypothetical protein